MNLYFFACILIARRMFIHFYYSTLHPINAKNLWTIKSFVFSFCFLLFSQPSLRYSWLLGIGFFSHYKVKLFLKDPISNKSTSHSICFVTLCHYSLNIEVYLLDISIKFSTYSWATSAQNPPYIRWCLTSNKKLRRLAFII